MHIGLRKTTPATPETNHTPRLSSGTVEHVAECIWLLAKLKPQSGAHTGACGFHEISGAMRRNAALTCLFSFSHSRQKVPL